MRLLFGEVRKMLRPLTAVAALLLILVTLLWAAASREGAFANLEAARDGRRYVSRHPSPCSAWGIEPGPECERLRRQEQRNADAWLRDTRSAAARVRGRQEGFGAGILAAGMAASLPGALVMLLMGASTAGGEWTRRTITYVFLQHARRHEVVLAKVAATWLAGLSLLALTWAALAVGGLLLQSLWPLPAPAPGELSSPLSVVGRASLVLLAFASIGVLAGAATRSAIGGVLAALGALGVSLVLSYLSATRPFTFARLVAEWMGFRRSAVGWEVYYMWVDGFPPMRATIGFIALSALSVVLTLAAAAIVRRAEV